MSQLVVHRRLPDDPECETGATRGASEHAGRRPSLAEHRYVSCSRIGPGRDANQPESEHEDSPRTDATPTPPARRRWHPHPGRGAWPGRLDSDSDHWRSATAQRRRRGPGTASRLAHRAGHHGLGGRLQCRRRVRRPRSASRWFPPTACRSWIPDDRYAQDRLREVSDHDVYLVWFEHPIHERSLSCGAERPHLPGQQREPHGRLG